MSQTNHDINCDVIRDLLPSYADGICSEASSRLIKEHLKSCGACSLALASMKASALDEAKVSDKKASALVKFRRLIELNKLAICTLFLVSVGLCLFFMNWRVRVIPTLYFYLLPLVLLGSYLILGTAPASVCGFRRRPLLCAAGFLAIPCGILAILSVFLWLRTEKLLNIPAHKCGPYINALLLLLIAADCALLAVLLWTYAKQAVLSLPLLVGSVTGILLLLAYRYMLYNMVSPEQYMYMFCLYTGVLLGEGAVFYLLISLKKYFFDRRSVTDYNK